MGRAPYPTFTEIKRWFCRDNWKGLAVAALLVILVAGVIKDALLLSQNKVAVGIDGYYYVLQITALKNDHRLYFPRRAPLVLYLFTAISYSTKDSVTAVKVGSLSLHALLCLGIFAVTVSTTRNLWSGVLGGALAAVSGLHLYMIAEFLNIMGALTFLIWSGWCTIRWTQTRKPMWIGLAVVLLAAAVLSHQLAIAVVTIVVVAFFLFKGLISSKKRLAFAALLAVVVIYFAPALAKAQAVIDIPDWLRTELTAIPQWPISQNYLPETLVLAVFAAVALIILLGPMRERAGSVGGGVVGLIAIWSLVVTLNPFLNEGNGWMGIVGRLRGLAYIQVALILPGVIWFLYPVQRKAACYLLAILPPFAILSALSPLPPGLQSEYLIRRERLTQQLGHHKDQISDDSLIIASHGDQFLVSATLGVASQQLAPETLSYPTVYWLIDTPKHQVATLESIAVVEQQTSRTLLVEDSALRFYLLSATDAEKRALLSYNLHLLMAYNRGGPENPF